MTKQLEQLIARTLKPSAFDGSLKNKTAVASMQEAAAKLTQNIMKALNANDYIIVKKPRKTMPFRTPNSVLKSMQNLQDDIVIKKRKKPIKHRNF